MKSSKNIGKNIARQEVKRPTSGGPGLAGALAPLLKGGKEQGYSKGVLDAMRKDIGESKGKTKCGEVTGRLRQVGPCRGDWSGDGDVV